MLISRVPDEDIGKTEGTGHAVDPVDNSLAYRTASELFDIMANNLNLNSDEEDSLTPSDLVLIYQNLDLGTNLMATANDFNKPRAPNQYVESIVYKECDSDTDLSEINSSEDIHNLMAINEERINMLTPTTSYENFHYQNNRGLQLSSSNVTFDIDKKYIFDDIYSKSQIPYTQQKLDTIKPKKLGMPELPVTMLDYICCKRFEEHYNFDMDNIIRYVKLTIDQLKRISNGDYLTDRAKEKWREVDNVDAKKGEIVQQQTVLANTTSIPLLIKRKVSGNSTTRDDLVISPVDVRSISKILERKIIVEVPKTLCGTYKLFSRCCDDNLILRCKKNVKSEDPSVKSEESRVDLVVQLNRSKSGHVISKINSIIILQKSECSTSVLPLLPLKYTETDSESFCKENTVIELEKKKNEEYDDKKEDQVIENDDDNKSDAVLLKHTVVLPSFNSHSIFSDDAVSVDLASQSSHLECQGVSGSSYDDSSREYVAKIDSLFNNVHPDELRINMRKINMSSLPEESAEDNSSSQKNKRRSPTRNRIKSPYENKSFVIEEKKRRRLLEIRQRREKNKLVLTANGSKVNKHKFPLPPLTSSSVTKLSITNKSFYNSIYGENNEKKPDKIKNRKESLPEFSVYDDPDNPKLPIVSQERLGQKCVSKDFYLDDADSQMMYLDIKNKGRCSETSSTNDYNKMDIKMYSNLFTASDIVENNMHFNSNETENTPRFIGENNELNIEETEISPNVKHNNSPIQTPSVTDTKPSKSKLEGKETQKGATTAEFRKSIDKIYELINKLGKSESNDTKLRKSKFTAVERPVCNDGAGESIMCSDSGTSVKHQLTSSNPSCYSFEKVPAVEGNQSDQVSPVSISVPASKVIISSKSHNPKEKINKLKKDRKNVDCAAPQPNVENPLKAISQFLHEIDHVQRNRKRVMTEKGRKPEVSFADVKVDSRPVVMKGTRAVQHRTDQRIEKSMEKPPKIVQKERKKNIPIIMQPPIESKGPATKTLKKNVFDIVDEMKEARGEAVRGPSKPSSRLDSLAQPRKAYIHAQIEEFQERYGRSIVTDRLQKLSGSSTGQPPPAPKIISPRGRRKERKPSPDTELPKQPSSSQPAVLEIPKVKKKFNITIPNIPQNKLTSSYSTGASSENSLKKSIAGRFLPEKHSQVSNANEFIRNGKTRVPLIPNEIEMESVISSVGESSTIGSKIHEMLDGIVPLSPRNNIETKIKNIISKRSEETDTEIGSGILQTHKIPVNEKSSIECPLKIKRDVIGDTIPEENGPAYEDDAQFAKTLDIALNTALSQRLSTGSFHRRSNLILTPKQSTHEVLLLQSGDSNSVLLRSTISQNLQITKSREDLNCFPELNNLDWMFTPFPLQMPIVQYSFPKYEFQEASFKQLQNEKCPSNNDELISKNNISVQCYKGVPVDILSGKSGDFESRDFMFLKSNPSVIIEESEEMKSELTEENEAVTEQQSVLEHDTKESTETVELYRDKKTEICIKSTVMSVDKEQSKESECILPSGHTSIMGYTDSLDVLVGLLDEIQNITSCQSQIANTDSNCTENFCEDMETILKSAAALDQHEARNIISISSLDKLRKLDSNASILSFYLSGNQDNIDNRFKLRPFHADKEVDAVVPLEFENKCTNVPSRIFPITVNHSTNVSSTLFGVLSQPSSHSLLTSNEYSLKSARSMTSIKRVNLIKLPKDRKEEDMPVVVYKRKPFGEDINKKIPNKKTMSKDNTEKDCQKSQKFESAIDPVMKMKRDILVTMYSVLVLTVFAALSFPELLYRA